MSWLNGLPPGLLPGLLLGLFLGCSGRDGEKPAPVELSEDSGRVGQPSEWSWEPEASAADLPLASIEDAVHKGLVALLAVHPPALYEAYAEALLHGTPACPGVHPAVGYTMGWAQDCSTPDGWGFSGRSQAAWLHNLPIDGVLYLRYGELITNARITVPGGSALDIDGYGELLAWEDEQGEHEESWIFGTFRHEGSWLDPRGPAAEWLDDGASLSLSRRVDLAADGTQVRLEGGLSRSADLPAGVVGITTRDLILGRDEAGCRAEGAILVQGAQGERHLLSLDALDGCEACGEVSGSTGPAGRVCFAVEPLLDGLLAIMVGEP